MANKMLRLADVPALVEAMLAEAIVVGPSLSEQLSDEAPAALYSEIHAAQDLWLDSGRPSKSLKEFFFPPREVLFTYRRSETGVEVTEPELETRPRIVFGARPCDAAALPVMDQVFGWGEQDNTYFYRREHTTIVTVACDTPDNTCFCTSLGGSPAGTAGADVLLTRLGDIYHVSVLSNKGAQLVATYSDYFREANPALDLAQEDTARALEDKIVRVVDVAPIRDIAFDDPLWQELIQQCVDCGVCTFLCPTCHCFDIQDEGNEAEGQRVRLWDSCAFREFTRMTVAQPRPEHYRRYRQRIMHKFQYYPTNFDAALCVGCGRCVAACPVGVDITEIISRLGASLAAREGE